MANPTRDPEETLTASQLEAKLPAFEAAIREQGLKASTIESYMGCTRFFIRWLAADGTPERWVAQRDRQRTRHVLDELAHKVDEQQICDALDAYQVATKSEAALRALVAVTGGSTDLRREDHRNAILTWLWAWRCRHLRRADHDLTSHVLGEWWEAFSGRLPPISADLTSLERLDLHEVECAYDALAGAVGARSGAPSRRADPALGDTAASEVLVAVGLRSQKPVLLAHVDGVSCTVAIGRQTDGHHGVNREELGGGGIVIAGYLAPLHTTRPPVSPAEKASILTALTLGDGSPTQGASRSPRRHPSQAHGWRLGRSSA